MVMELAEAEHVMSKSNKLAEQTFAMKIVEDASTCFANINKVDNAKSIFKDNTHASPQELFSTFAVPNLPEEKRNKPRNMENKRANCNDTSSGDNENNNDKRNINNNNNSNSNISSSKKATTCALFSESKHSLSQEVLKSRKNQNNITLYQSTSKSVSTPTSPPTNFPSKVRTSHFSPAQIPTPSRPVLLQSHPHGSFYYMNQSYIGYSTSHHPGFYGISNGYPDPHLYYTSQNVHQKNGQCYLAQNDTNNFEHLTKLSRAKQSFASVQGQMAANQIPLCLVQDSTGHLHQLVYTVPEKLYEQYVAAAAKGAKVKVQPQLDNSKAPTENSVGGKQQVKSKMKLHPVKQNDATSKDYRNKTVNVPIKEINKENNCLNSGSTDQYKCKQKNISCLDKSHGYSVKNESSDVTEGDVPKVEAKETSTQAVLATADDTSNKLPMKLYKDINGREIRLENSAITEIRKEDSCSNKTNLARKEIKNNKNTEYLKEDFLSINHRTSLAACKSVQGTPAKLKQDDTKLETFRTCIDLTNRSSQKKTAPLKESQTCKVSPLNTSVANKISQTRHHAAAQHKQRKSKQENQSRRSNNSKKTGEDCTYENNLTSIDDILSRKDTDFIPKSDVEELLRTLKRKLEESEKGGKCNKRAKYQNNHLSNSHEDEFVNTLSPLNCTLNHYEDSSNSLLLSRDMGSVSSVDSALSYSQQSSVSSVSSEANGNIFNTQDFEQIFSDNTEIDIDREIIQESIFNSSSQNSDNVITTYNNNQSETGIDLNFFDNFKEDISSDNLFCLPSSGNELLLSPTTNEQSSTCEKQKSNGTMYTGQVSFPSGQPAADMDLFDHLWSELENL